MPNWSELLYEVDSSANVAQKLTELRKGYLNKIASITNRNIIAYYSGWLKYSKAPHIGIDDLDKNAFMNTINGLDKSKGLDLILHSPGGDIAATESLVVYLKDIFDGDIRAIVPQISMSAGTMIALSCREIFMGKQSSLGPIDPQINGMACQAVKGEFLRAIKDAKANPATLGVWQPIISKYSPTFLTLCENSIKWSEHLATQWLKAVNPNVNMAKFKKRFLDHDNSFSHNRHLSKQDCKNVGLNITDLEADQSLQDAVLSLHHCYMILFDKYCISKIVENHEGRAYVQQFKQ